MFALRLNRIFSVLSLLVTVIFAARAQDDDAPSKNNLAWVDARTLGLEGQGWTNTLAPYDRLPAKAKGVVPEPVWNLSRQSAGMLVRFVTDAPAIHAHWSLTSSNLGAANLTQIAKSGLDLYVKLDSGKWRWLSVGVPKSLTNEVTLAGNLKSVTREYLLYLPLYNGIKSLELVVTKGFELKPAGPWGKGERKPIVFYGTSILQGAGASRPGMVHSAILGRHLQYPTINLGFSGNGRMEPALADLLAELDPSVYVLDCLPNMYPNQITERVEPFVRRLREAHPKTPIVLVEDRRYPNGFLLKPKATRNDEDHAALKAAFGRLKKADVPGLYYISGDDLLGDDGEGTVDGSHPTDLGFTRQAEIFEKTLKPLLQ